MVTDNSRGALSVPCLLMIGVIAVGGFGTWSVLRHWRLMMESQLSIDRCVGEIALSLKSDLQKLDASNLRMKTIRAAAVAAFLIPGSEAAIQAELEAEFVLQNAIRLAFNLKTQKEAVSTRCANIQARLTRFSTLDWDRDPPDSIGENPFKWSSQSNGSAPSFEFELRESRGIHSAAKVSQNEENSGNWQALWANLY